MLCVPTLRKEIDLQCEQRAKNNTPSMANMIYTNCFGLPFPAAERLASRAALIRSGILKSGLELFAQFRAFEAWRLCRFNSLLAVSRLSIVSPSPTMAI